MEGFRASNRSNKKNKNAKGGGGGKDLNYLLVFELGIG